MRKLSLEEWKEVAEKINSAEKAVSAIGFNFPKSISNKIRQPTTAQRTSSVTRMNSRSG